MNDIDIDLSDFEKLPQKQQLKAIYKNTSGMKKDIILFKNDFVDHIKNDKFHFRTIKWMIFALAILFGLGKFIGAI